MKLWHQSNRQNAWCLGSSRTRTPGKSHQRIHHQPACRPLAATSLTQAATRQLLDNFWEARGVLDPAHRKQLVDAAEGLEAEPQRPLDSAPLATDVPLPGLPATWQMERSTPEVVAASRRLLALQQLLGGGLEQGPRPEADSDIFGRSRPAAASVSRVDVVWMVVREPGLLSADLAQITGRLLDMKLATYGMAVDVLRLVEAQPALLLSDSWRLDLGALQDTAPSTSTAAPSSTSAASPASTSAPAPTATSSSSSASPSASASLTSSPASSQAGAQAPASSITAGPGGPTPGPEANARQQLVDAWEYGVASDDDQEWSVRLGQLAEYGARHGDTSVGFRDGDDAELARWATKQRADARKGRLDDRRRTQLEGLGFVFDADEAEWLRWFADLLAFKAETGHASPMPLVTGADMYLINWASVQRIARRTGVLPGSRVQRLTEAGFDWSGADPLS
ncbi:hypothetical protein HYH03_014630 [Edaphochlamys debaryana]|uniref:Helicase-associated domain-containing protein n=1 Tax=Edaphochlamys debaryana TaxID=47281 RepID=A0A836BRR3_9CHLO|nr:hypothetical protein HYH03_014630 [Edaphochlamys debaryana]|eukprot:KAG2486701.1 hypothetical protein HYH03_014630 [Edaphochlamys debaryana]